MHQINAPNNPDLILKHSPLVRACYLTFGYVTEHGEVGLTKSMAFNRKFLHWAAEAFTWQGQTKEDLFYLNKVLNEHDFPAAGLVHEFLLHLKLGRHYKGGFRTTKAGEKIAEDPVALFDTIIPTYLFDIDHNYGYQSADHPFGNWDVFLNVLNVELQIPRTGRELSEVFFGPSPGSGRRSNETFWSFYVHVLRPLCWAGLLQEAEADKRLHTEDHAFAKTALWPAALTLETDGQLKPVALN